MLLLVCAMFVSGCHEPSTAPASSTTTLSSSPSAASAEASPTFDERAGVTDNEILIGSCAALEGGSSFLGTQTVIGAEAYIDYINDESGVNGRKIRLLSQDDSYDPQKAIDCFNALLKSNVFATAFFVGTPTAARYVPMAEIHHIPLIGLFTGAQLLQDPFRPYVISVRASYYDEAREQIDQLWGAGMTKIAVVFQDDAFGAAVLEGVKIALKRHASQPVALSSFARTAVEPAAAIAAVKASNPDAVILVGSYKSVAAIVKQAKGSGWNPLFTTVSFVGTEAFIDEAGDAAEGTVITQVVPPYTSDSLPTVALYKRLLAKYYPRERPNFVSLEGFIDAMVMVEGLKRAGRDLTRSGLVRSIETIHDLDIGLGPNLHLNYGPNDHKGFDRVFPTVVRNHQAVPLQDWKVLSRHA